MPQNIVPHLFHPHQPSTMGKSMIILLQNSRLFILLIKDTVLYIQAAKFNINILLDPLHILDLYPLYRFYILVLPLTQDTFTIVVIDALMPRFLVEFHRHYFSQRAILFEIFAELGKLTSYIGREGIFYTFYLHVVK